MALNLREFREALKDQLKATLDASSRPANVYAYPPDSPELPAVLIRHRPGAMIDYHVTMSAVALTASEWEVEVRVGGWDIDAEMAIDDYLSTGTDCSIIDAIEDDRTLGALPLDVWVRASSAPVRVLTEDGAREWLAARFEIQLHERRG